MADPDFNLAANAGKNEAWIGRVEIAMKIVASAIIMDSEEGGKRLKLARMAAGLTKEKPDYRELAKLLASNFAGIDNTSEGGAFNVTDTAMKAKIENAWDLLAGVNGS